MKLSKSKLALAKVINENGGWLIGADWSFQPKHDYGDVWFSSGGKKPIRAGDGFSHGCVDGEWIYGSIISHKSMIGNWHQTILSREEYYQACPKADEDGWIEWKGGKCPVGYDSLVDVRFPDGSEYFNTDADWDWSSTSDTPISHYRPSKKDVNPEFCESVTHGIPGPESIDGLCAKVTEENKHQHVDAKPTIEQLAQDYRNANDYALRLQEEANDAWTAAEKAKGELIDAGKALGLVLSVAEPELVIADWRDLRVNDVIFVGEYDDCESGEYVVIELEDRDYGGGYAVKAAGIDGNDRWIDTARE